MSDISKVNPLNETWDYLVILDACRYDYFEDVYKDYIEGNLSKKISAGSCTNQWRDTLFPDYYDDIVYITANPMISATSPVYGYLASDHFHKVVEVWKDGWDKQKGTVLPETLTKAALKAIAENPGKRFIIHYIQPHAPYLSEEAGSAGYEVADMTVGRKLMGVDEMGKDSRIKSELFKRLMKLLKNSKLLGKRPDWVLRKFLRMKPITPMEALIRNGDLSVLRNAYMHNLKAVLRQVAILLEYLSGKIVVTADHGEFLGEEGFFAHPPNSSHPILIEVPWLDIHKQKAEKVYDDSAVKPEPNTKNQPESSVINEEEEMAERLRALGYID